MDIKYLKDFYIDQDGDIKASYEFEGIFVTDTKKLNSKYLLAETINEIEDAINKIAPPYGFVNIPVFRQYAIKTNKEGEVKSIKIYIDSNKTIDDINVLLEGIEFSHNSLMNEFYFVTHKEKFNNFLIKHNLSYKLMEYDTHTPILYSIRYSYDTDIKEISNIKVYYVRNEDAFQYTNDFIQFLKNMFKFK